MKEHIHNITIEINPSDMRWYTSCRHMLFFTGVSSILLFAVIATYFYGTISYNALLVATLSLLMLPTIMWVVSLSVLFLLNVRPSMVMSIYAPYLERLTRKVIKRVGKDYWDLFFSSAMVEVSHPDLPEEEHTQKAKNLTGKARLYSAKHTILSTIKRGKSTYFPLLSMATATLALFLYRLWGVEITPVIIAVAAMHLFYFFGIRNLISSDVQKGEVCAVNAYKARFFAGLLGGDHVINEDYFLRFLHSLFKVDQLKSNSVEKWSWILVGELTKGEFPKTYKSIADLVTDTNETMNSLLMRAQVERQLSSNFVKEIQDSVSGQQGVKRLNDYANDFKRKVTLKGEGLTESIDKLL